MEQSVLVGIVLIVVGVMDAVVFKAIVGPRIAARNPGMAGALAAVFYLSALVMLVLGALLATGRIEVYL